MNNPPSAIPDPQLHRRFGLLQATALNMTNMIGVGPFITIPALMTAMNGPQAMIGWLAALILAMMDGMVWAELAASKPGSGGTYVYLRDAFGPKLGRLMSFLFIWQFILSGPLEIATGFVGMKEYVAYIIPGFQPKFLPPILGGLCLILLYRKIGDIGKITITLWIGMLLTVAAVILTGVFNFDSKIAFDFPPNAFQFSAGFLFGLGAATRVGLYDYLGYYDVCYIGGEVRDPGRTMARSILLSVILVAGIYIAINFSIIGIVSWREFVPAAADPPPIVAMMMERIHGKTIAKILSMMVIWTAVGSIFALLLGYSRIPYAAAVDGNFFKSFSRLHPTKDFPHISLILITVISIACAYAPLAQIIDYLLITRIVVQFVGQTFALIALRKNFPKLERPYKMPFYPIPAIIALCGWAFVFFTYPLKTIGYGVAVVTLGLMVYAIWKSFYPDSRRAS